ncbi:MAG: prepilin-type N-terminal cleavage/methylation domain-containing protein [candidate division WOR-3 bacterium]|nr:prepilin-type N-terminal cleavage/methylation domain-containing protein [candidate division WOR-3 bacterium]MCX7757616.1 prepilin-type N-terminal cleavage/methylation domain-containing protein [candidate division WOR-3 bacterium]MDW7987266.1 prepilin-type N-terminal cleavage/methylation domain-containing protein [candidate division WOR-3 bacterium]
MINKSIYKEKGFTLIETLIIILILGIILGMSIPNYNVVRERARIGAQKMNMYNVAQVIEYFHAERGYYAEDFYEDEYGSYFPGGDPYADPPVMGKLPRNPWTGNNLEPDEFNPDWYENASDVSNTELYGPNDEDGYNAGEMRYGVWYPPGANRPQLWGLIGMDGNGRSIRQYTSEGTTVIFVIHN